MFANLQNLNCVLYIYSGADACKHAKMTGTMVSAVDCGSPDSCKEAIISISDPADYFALECSGLLIMNYLSHFVITSYSLYIHFVLTSYVILI